MKTLSTISIVFFACFALIRYQLFDAVGQVSEFSRSVLLGMYMNSADDLHETASFTVKPRNDAVLYAEKIDRGTTMNGQLSAPNITGAVNGLAPLIVTPPFSEIPIDIPDTGLGAGGWGDINNDGKLDLVLTGRITESLRLSAIYLNNGSGQFTHGLTLSYQLDSSVVALGDFNNDGNVDILLSGCLSYVSGNCVSRVTQLYRNDTESSNPITTGLTMTEIATGLPAVNDGALAWGDYDLDGRQDILLMGLSGSGLVTKIYHNGGSSGGAAWQFIDSGIALAAVEAGSVAWGDYDSDGKPDILLTGWTGANRIIKLYHNNGSTGSGWSFSEVAISLPGVSSGNGVWGDYDNDGRLDILLTGFPNTGVFLTKVFHNDGPVSGGWAFHDINAPLTGVDFAPAAWGDFDNDGLLDVLAAGYDLLGRVVANVYHNENGSFVDMNAGLTGVYLGSTLWGDYDGDGHLDILLNGCSQWTCPAVTTILYHNNLTSTVTAPQPPTTLNSYVSGDSVTLNWSSSTLNPQVLGGQTYNVRVGTTPGGADVVAPLADSSTGFRFIPAMGNAGTNTSFSLRNLQKGTSYYWSVQSVNNAFTGSAFSTEMSFTIVMTPSGVSILGLTTGIVNQSVFLTATVEPITTTVPITYVWSTANSPVITKTGGVSDSASFLWATPGLKVVTVTANNGTGMVADHHVISMTIAPLVAISVIPSSITMTVGMTQVFSVHGVDSLGHDMPISPVWSTDAGIVTGSSLVAQQVPASSRHVTATVGDISGSAFVDIVAGALMTIGVVPDSFTITVGMTRSVQAIGFDAFHNIVPINPIWSTDAGSMIGDVFSASNTAANNRQITATVDVIFATIAVNVVGGPIDNVRIAPSSVELVTGAPQQFSATCYDKYGNELLGLPLFWWVSQSDAGTINATGMFTASKKPGRYAPAILVVSGLVSDTGDVTVVWPNQVYMPFMRR